MDEVYEPREDSHLLEKYVKRLAKGSVLEIGIGSGIQTAAALARADSVLGVDINQKAIEFCKDKIKSEKARFLKSDLFSNVSGKFDTIIFNAPYLPDDEECKDVALDGGKQGHEIIGKFLAEAKNFLAKDGIILLVFSSFTGKEKVDSLIKENGLSYKELERIHISFEDIYCYRITRM